MSNLTDEQLIDAVEACEDKSASDIAHYMGYDRSTISRHLKQLERDGMVTHRDVRGAGGLLALWRIADDCFKHFDTESKKCKRCTSAVECYEASQ